jgi:hypothetical protein
MKVIDLLNKIANGEEVPKKIKYRDWLYEFEKDCNDYLCQYDSLLYRENDDVRQFLNDEVEIIEEHEEEPQEHKIPEKFKVHSWGDKDKYGSYVDSPFPTNEELMNKINEILDYLSKEE